MTMITKVIDSFYNGKMGKALANPKATAATAAIIATVSNVSKDAVNCAYYTTQSLNNERIPEEQRKFVAALDLSNGLLNVILQVVTSFGLANAITSIFDKIADKSKDFSVDEGVIKEKFNSLSKELKEKTNWEQFSKEYPQHIKARRNMARTGFTVLAVNIAMQILTKRILTPLIATPLATVFKNKFEEAEQKKNLKNNKQNEAVEYKTAEHKTDKIA